MVSFSQKMLLLSLIISSMCMMSNAVRRRHVNITNKIGKNVLVRCRSKNDDQTYSVSFKNNIFRTTLFFCRFTWDDKLHCFNIYDAHRDACTNCNWSLFTDGPVWPSLQRTRLRVLSTIIIYLYSFVLPV